MTSLMLNQINRDTHLNLATQSRLPVDPLPSAARVALENPAIQRLIPTIQRIVQQAEHQALIARAKLQYNEVEKEELERTIQAQSAELRALLQGQVDAKELAAKARQIVMAAREAIPDQALQEWDRVRARIEDFGVRWEHGDIEWPQDIDRLQRAIRAYKVGAQGRLLTHLNSFLDAAQGLNDWQDAARKLAVHIPDLLNTVGEALGGFRSATEARVLKTRGHGLGPPQPIRISALGPQIEAPFLDNTLEGYRAYHQDMLDVVLTASQWGMYNLGLELHTACLAHAAPAEANAPQADANINAPQQGNAN